MDVLRRGRTYSTVETRIVQHDKLCSAGLVLLDSGAEDVYRVAAEMPDVPGPLECPLRDFGVIGRDIRVVDGAYNFDPDDEGPPELFVWMRYRDRPEAPAMQAAPAGPGHHPLHHCRVDAASSGHHRGTGPRDPVNRPDGRGHRLSR